MPSLQNLAHEFQDVSHFAIVYIEEAHASNLWPIGSVVGIQRHTTLEERILAARRLFDYGIPTDTNIQILVDPIEGSFDAHFHAWPERFFAIQSCQFRVIGKRVEEDKGFDRRELLQFLQSLRS